jgi:peptidoglycan hydrolase-like protein with peptidoglycan-binding domain
LAGFGEGIVNHGFGLGKATLTLSDADCGSVGVQWVWVLGKRKKTSAVVDAPRPSKPFAVVLSLAALLGSVAIVYNAFFNQSQAVATLAASDGTTHATVMAGQKSSRTITLKYDSLVEDVQRELLATGHFNGLVDGVTGPRTKVAIEAFQRDNKLDVTGEISKDLLERIQYMRKLNQAAEFTGSIAPRIEAAPVVAAKPVVGDNAIAKVQQRLALLGYDPGSRSGQLDEGTRSAIMIFEMDHGLPVLGKISKGLLGGLKAAEGTKKP